MEKWIIIDASSILFRYFYAAPGFYNSNGQNINALKGFCNIILHFFYSSFAGEKIIVIFDGAKRNFKKEMNSDYKSNRRSLPDELKSQLLLAEECCIRSKIFFDKHILYEADDLIASYAHQLKGEIYIVGTDKDFLQLISDTIFIWDYKQQEKIDSKKVIARYGIKPSQIVDFFSMTGDYADNLNGVMGIGKKLATKILKQYGTLENAMKSHLNKKYKFEQAIKTRKIIELKRDIPIKNFASNSVDLTLFNNFMREHGIMQNKSQTNIYNVNFIE